MGIYLRQSHLVKPARYGSEADVQYSIAKNSEKIYGVDPDSNVLVMPLFFGFPCLDYSGKQNHGTPYGGVAYHSGSLDFDGVDDYVGVPTINEVVTNVTYSAWINPDSIGAWNGIIFSRSAYNVGMIFHSSGNVGYTWQNDYNFNSGLASPVDKLSFVSVTFYPAGATVYVGTDGVLSSASSGTAHVAQTMNDVKIGTDDNQATRWFNGLIDEVRISNVALTAEQIALFYERPWDLYRRVGRTYYSITAAPSIYIPRIIII